MPFVYADVEQGRLRGMDVGAVTSFLGVPYGASTAGANRFRRPEPAPHWDGVRDALEFGDSSPQVDLRSRATGSLGSVLTMLTPRGGSVVECSPTSEDCLRLNVWAPSGEKTATLPVLVWLHGGGYVYGSGNGVSANNGVLSAAGDVVVVTVTHRLGLLGFLDLRDLGEGDSANAGMLDIVAALDWIQRNIATFGGDPTRVTICGQSGGAGKVAALNAMPAAAGLFHRSIMMSGPFGRAYSASDTGELRRQVTAALGVSSVDDLRALPTDRLLEAQAEALRSVSALTSGQSFELDAVPGFGPSIDATHLPTDPFGEVAAAGLRGKELLIGWTSHDASGLLVADPTYTSDMSRDEAARRVDRLAHIDEVTYADLEIAYPDEAPNLLFARRMTSLVYEQPSRKIADLAAAEASGSWVYEFAQPTEVLSNLLGATHSLDISYAFGAVDRIPLTGRSLDRHSVSRDMMRAWSRFAHDGDPGWAKWSDTEQRHVFGRSYGQHSRLPDPIDMTAPLESAVPYDAQQKGDSATMCGAESELLRAEEVEVAP